MKKNITHISIGRSSSLLNAMKKMSKNGQKSLLVTNKNSLIGTLSDGDIRKAILSGKTLDSKVETALNPEPFFVRLEEHNKEKIKKIFIKHRFDIIPIISESGDLIGCHTIQDFLSRPAPKRKNIPVIIMAGGKGTRLKPFTNILPKPLIPLNDMTVIEKIIETFTSRGFNDFIMSINYKGKILKAFFEELEPKFSIDFIQEKKALGTAGALYMLKKSLKNTFILTNCDVIFNFDYEDLIKSHKSSKADITMVASAKKVTIPYGVCNISDNGTLESLAEKPSSDYLINTGFYIIEPSVLKFIPDNKFMHITDLISLLVEKGNKINIFPIEDNSWTDIGQWSEYREALKRLG